MNRRQLFGMVPAVCAAKVLLPIQPHTPEVSGIGLHPADPKWFDIEWTGPPARIFFVKLFTKAPGKKRELAVAWSGGLRPLWLHEGDTFRLGSKWEVYEPHNEVWIEVWAQADQDDLRLYHGGPAVVGNPGKRWTGNLDLTPQPGSVSRIPTI
jgi:hypothetical protein